MDHHSWQIWHEDKQGVKERIEGGKELEAYNSAFGDNDLIIGFMVVEGFWEILAGIEADLLKKENGYSPRVLNLIWTLCELAGVGRIAHSGKVIGDQALLKIAGFQAEEIARVRSGKKHIIDTETLSNHLSRISRKSVSKSWWEHAGLLRQKRWYRGGVYAVDAHEIIIPYGKVENYEGAERVGEKCGYKLVVILNINPGQERVIAWKVEGLAHSERTMLRGLVEELSQKFGRLGEWMKLLVLDRGYWGAELLTELKSKHGVDYVTRVGNDELDIVKDIEGVLKIKEQGWYSRDEEHKEYGPVRVKACGINEVDMRPGKPIEGGKCNVVVADFFDAKAKPINELGRLYYGTSLGVNPGNGRSVFVIRDIYKRRWGIENQGFWVLTQRWNLDRLIARSIHLIRARLNFAFQLYNIENCCVWKHPGSYDEELHRLKRPQVGERLGRPSIMIYSEEGLVGAFQAKEYACLIKESIKRKLREALDAGEDIEQVLNKL